MKIVFIVMRFGKDGLATNIQQLTEGMVKRGHEVSIITSGFKKGTSEDDTFYNQLKSQFDALNVRMCYFEEPSGGKFKKLTGSFKSFAKIINYLREIDADVIHCHSPNLTFIPWLMGKKYVSTVHADTISPSWRYKHPTLLIAVSGGSKEFTQRVMNTPPDSIRMVYHGISNRFAEADSKESIKKLKESHKIPLDKTIIGFVGRITPMKGTDVLLNALGKAAKKSTKDNIHLVFVGDYQTEKDKQWLKQLLTENNLENQLTLIPFCDPKPYYQTFDVFVLPSRSDTFGLVAVESMMSGICTIRSDAYGAKDQITTGENGLIFDMDDYKTLGVLLNKVVEDEHYRIKLGESAKSTALERFTHDKMIDKTLEVYNELITI